MVEKAYEDFGSSFDLLNCHLIKLLVPGNPGLNGKSLFSVPVLCSYSIYQI